jgi:alpha-L-fucosidase 2
MSATRNQFSLPHATCISACFILTATILFCVTIRSYAAGQKLQVPKRGFISSTPATTWEEGLISGNGTIGANMLSRPLDETVIFTHERLFLPQGAPVMPPDSGPRLFEIRRLIDRGLYRQADQLVFDVSICDLKQSPLQTQAAWPGLDASLV